MVFCISQNRYVNEIVQTLSQRGYRSTTLASTGGFLKKGNTTLLIGTTNEQKDEVIRLIEQACDQEDQKKGAVKQSDSNRITLFVVDAFGGRGEKTGS